MSDAPSKNPDAPTADAPPQGPQHDTPAMRQHRRFKERHPGCVLFFRMGDFYEMFYEDAELAHRVLGVTLTQRTAGIPMAGVPYHSVETYLRRMIEAGHRVAVCEQVEDASQAKGVVERDVTRVVTPGTIIDEALLEEASENPLAVVVFHGETGTKGQRDEGTKATTPGVPTSVGMSSPTQNTPPTVSLAWAEPSTGDFTLCTLTPAEARDELARIAPRELLYCESATGDVPSRVRDIADAPGGVTPPLTPRPPWQFRLQEAVDTLRREFGVASLAGFGLDDADPALAAAGALLHYLLETQRGQSDPQKVDTTQRQLPHLRPPRRLPRDSGLIIDATSLASLEVTQTLRTGQVTGSLLGVLLSGGPDDTAAARHGPVTAMGKRLLRRWLCYPLCDLDAIAARHDVVQSLADDSRFLTELRDAMGGIVDLPRIVARLGVGRITPRDLTGLGESAARGQALAHTLSQRDSVQPFHTRAAAVASPLCDLAEHLGSACVDDPPAHMRDGGLIRDGFDAPLDEARQLQADSNDWLARYQKRLIEATNIPSLKVGYNKVFGYYIEVTSAHRDKAPDASAGWHRKQTLKNAERYITEDLKQYETKILRAQTTAVAREGELFFKLCSDAAEHIAELQAFAELVAELDVLACFAARAVRWRYVRPTMIATPCLDIKGGRHPVLDRVLGDRFVPNDLVLDPVERDEGTKGRRDAGEESGAGGRGNKAAKRGGDLAMEADYREVRGHQDTSGPASLRPCVPSSLALITGPNMAGKSTFIRQAALLTLLAHAGSFIPADAATIGITDRIFTRIGASDELHAGQSTFMVEMTEAARLCHGATQKSLVILDEIGRGTSTLDGLSLAWAITEHLAARGCRTLFATHYHELTKLAQSHHRVTNLHVTVREWGDEIVFLHRIVPGTSDRSYGIHVARLAGVPDAVVKRADEVLSQLAVNHNADIPQPSPPKGSAEPKRPPASDLPLFAATDHPALEALREVDIENLDPAAAVDVLRNLHARAVTEA